MVRSGEAGDGRDALASIQEIEPDVAVVDFSLPSLSGIQVVTALTDMGSPVQVLMLTAYTDSELVYDAIAAGARGYLLKDEPAEEIVTAIGAVVAGRSYFSAAVAVRLSQASAPATLLTQRERDVLRHIASGQANKQIAHALGLSVRTVETHRLNIKRKLGIDGQAELIKYAVENRGV